MAIIAVTASCESTLSIQPSYMLVETTDTFSQVQATGYLTGQTITPCGFLGFPQSFVDGQPALVSTSDQGVVSMRISINGSDISLVQPTLSVPKTLMTAPPDSSSSSLVLGTAYQNTLGYDVMLTVYLNITSSLTADILLGVGSTSSPTQQTIISGLTLAVLGIVPVTIYVPAGYYALLSTSGTISATISGQIAMPI